MESEIRYLLNRMQAAFKVSLAKTVLLWVSFTMLDRLKELVEIGLGEESAVVTCGGQVWILYDTSKVL